MIQDEVYIQQHGPHSVYCEILQALAMFSCPSLGYGNFGVFPSIWVEGHQKSLVCKLGIIGISFHTLICVFWGLKMVIITIFGPILLIFDLERSGFHQIIAGTLGQFLDTLIDLQLLPVFF